MGVHVIRRAGGAVRGIDGREAVNKVPHIIVVAAVRLTTRAGIEHQTLHAVNLRVARGGGRDGRGGIQADSAGEQVYQEIDGIVITRYHHRVDKGGGI